jgi:phenylalanyl-tRNA synthetase beta subunit
MDNAIGIRNAFNEEYTHMRRSLAPRLLIACAENLKHTKDISFFEIGKIYSKSDQNSVHTFLENIDKKPFPENKMIAGITTMKSLDSLRNDLDTFLQKNLGYLPPIHMEKSLPYLHPGMSGRYALEDKVLISFGVLHPEVAGNF